MPAELCSRAAALLSAVLMGGAGIGLLGRFIRLLRGEETENALDAAQNRRIPWREMGVAAAAAVLSRILILLLAYGMYCSLHPRNAGFFGTLDDIWGHWDTRHYIGIAEGGYPAAGDERLRLVFFPLYPLLMRAMSVLTGGDVFAGGQIVSLLCTGLAAALLYDLCAMHGGRKTAALAVAYFLLSPMSLFLCCVYTEALFLCLTLGAVVCFRRGHPWWAALLGAASALTRLPGVIIAGLPIIALLSRIPKRQLTLRAVSACAAQVLIIFSGLFAYWLLNFLVTGDPFMYMTYQRENWFQEVGSFVRTTATTVQSVFDFFGEEDWFFGWVTQLGAIFAMYLLLLFRGKTLPFDLAAYSFVYVLTVLAPTWLLSGPRYLYALCTVPLLKAGVTKREGVHAAMLLASLGLLVVYVYGYTIAGRVM